MFTGDSNWPTEKQNPAKAPHAILGQAIQHTCKNRVKGATEAFIPCSLNMAGQLWLHVCLHQASALLAKSLASARCASNRHVTKATNWSAYTDKTNTCTDRPSQEHLFLTKTAKCQAEIFFNSTKWASEKAC